MCHQLKFCRLTLFQQVNYLCKLGVKWDSKWILERHLLFFFFFFSEKSLHSIQHFVYNFSGNSSIISKSHHLFHMISIWILNLHPKLYQTLSEYQEIPLMSASGSGIIGKKCSKHELPSINPDWHSIKNLFCIKKLNKEMNMNL